MRSPHFFLPFHKTLASFATMKTTLGQLEFDFCQNLTPLVPLTVSRIVGDALALRPPRKAPREVLAFDRMITLRDITPDVANWSYDPVSRLYSARLASGDSVAYSASTVRAALAELAQLHEANGAEVTRAMWLIRTHQAA